MKAAAISASLVCALGLTVPAVSAPNSPTGAVATVAQLYKDFAFEAVLEEPRFGEEDLIDQPSSVLSRYFDGTLVALILKDRECARREQAICAIDFVPWWDSQDASGATVRITATKDPTLVAVTVAYPSAEKRRLNYKLTKTARGWRISDILFLSDGPNQKSLLTLLKQN